MDPWITEDSQLVDDLWPDAPAGETFTVLVEAAQNQCAGYAPKLQPEAAVPGGYKVALVMQARAIHRSFLAGSGDTIGPDGMTVTVWPMDRTVKALLRPPKLRAPR